MNRRCRVAFQRLLESTEPLVISDVPCPTDIRIVNIVASVHLLEAGETLCLPNILYKARGAGKYTPASFQAMVLRFGDNSPAGNVTALVHPNGKINIVGAVNREHARFAAQQFRLFIEGANGPSHCEMGFSNFKV